MCTPKQKGFYQKLYNNNYLKYNILSSFILYFKVLLMF